jgi:hypothetical protein
MASIAVQGGRGVPGINGNIGAVRAFDAARRGFFAAEAWLERRC